MLFAGGHDIRVSTIDNVCKAFGISVYDFFRAENDMETVANGSEKGMLAYIRQLDDNAKQRLLGYLQALVENNEK